MQLPTSGNAHLFSFPFWIITDKTVPPQPLTVTAKKWSLRLYAPFRSAPANYTWMPEVPYHKIPWPSDCPVAVPIGTIPSLVAVPVLTRPEAKGGLQLIYTPVDVSSLDNAPMDSLRVDNYGHPDVHEYVNLLLKQLREMSHQWWIGKSVASILGHQRAEFSVTDNGAPIEAPMSSSRGHTGNGYELSIDDSIWRRVAEAAAKGEAVTGIGEQLMDAQFYLSIEDHSGCVLNLATACELAKEIAFAELSPSNGEGNYCRVITFPNTYQSNSKLCTGARFPMSIRMPLMKSSGYGARVMKSPMADRAGTGHVRKDWYL